MLKTMSKLYHIEKLNCVTRTWLTERVRLWCEGECVDDDEEELSEEIEHMEDLREPREDGDDGGVCHDHWASPPLMSSST